MVLDVCVLSWSPSANWARLRLPNTICTCTQARILHAIIRLPIQSDRTGRLADRGTLR